MGTYETIYPGTDPSIPRYESLYQPITYKVNAGDIGMTLDGRTANQLRDVGFKLNTGAKVLEVQGTTAGVLESMPKQHLREIGRQMKLAGATPTIHGPIIEVSGITQQGWDEGERLGAERQLTSAVLRSHDLDPEGNISVTTHSTAGLPEMEQMTKTEEGEKRGNIFVIDPRTGKWSMIKPEKRFFPEKGEFIEEGKEFDVDDELKRHNQNSWIQNLSGINRYANLGEGIVEGATKKKQAGLSDEETDNMLAKIKQGDINSIKDEKTRKIAENMQRELAHGELYLRDAYQNMKQMFDIAYDSAIKQRAVSSNSFATNQNNEQDIKNLQDFARKVAPKITPELDNNPERLIEFSEMIEQGLDTLKNLKETPKTVVRLQEFVLDKSSQTFANVATNAYKEFGKTAPILNIENPPAGFGLSRAEDLKMLVEKSREKMAENLIRDKNLSRSEAEKISEKMIGATWDVGHINMLRKKGYSEEDIIKETEKIAPFVKHVHLSDNFGYEHTELPMGMGNVPIKEMMKKLGEKGFEGKKIVEAIQWFEHFQDAPGQPPKGGGHALSQSYGAFNSSMYTTGAGYSWGQIPGLDVYVPGVGQGAVAPPVSQSLYGTTFSTLPQELGGNIGGDHSRFSGTPSQ
ncbi:MAG: sugar phosphate isomerase/epimerase [Nanoarchaeota archaeon]|nr:sugar phosphate isomerase/epimerase [Nanoarchaeota archaeon]